jgi:hypothetical protein
VSRTGSQTEMVREDNEGGCGGGEGNDPGNNWRCQTSSATVRSRPEKIWQEAQGLDLSLNAAKAGVGIGTRRLVAEGR